MAGTVDPVPDISRPDPGGLSHLCMNDPMDEDSRRYARRRLRSLAEGVVQRPVAESLKVLRAPVRADPPAVAGYHTGRRALEASARSHDHGRGALASAVDETLPVLLRMIARTGRDPGGSGGTAVLTGSSDDRDLLAQVEVWRRTVSADLRIAALHPEFFRRLPVPDRLAGSDALDDALLTWFVEWQTTLDGLRHDYERFRRRAAVLGLLVDLDGGPAGTASIDESVDVFVDTEDLAVAAGVFAVVKYPSPNGPVLIARQLSQVEISTLERYPEMQAHPETVLGALALAIDAKQVESG